jgi:hypothetical protein
MQTSTVRKFDVSRSIKCAERSSGGFKAKACIGVTCSAEAVAEPSGRFFPVWKKLSDTEKVSYGTRHLNDGRFLLYMEFKKSGDTETIARMELESVLQVALEELYKVFNPTRLFVVSKDSQFEHAEPVEFLPAPQSLLNGLVKIDIPTPDEIRVARVRSGLTPDQVGELLEDAPDWRQFESEVGTKGHRTISAKLWAMFLLLTKQHPQLSLVPV